MKKIALLALLFGGMMIFTAAIAVFASGMPIDTVKKVSLDPQTTGTSSDDSANNIASQDGGTNTTNQNATSSTDAHNTPSTGNEHGGSWMDGSQWSVCPE